MSKARSRGPRGSPAGQSHNQAGHERALRSRATGAAIDYVRFRTTERSLHGSCEIWLMMRLWDALHAAKQRPGELATATQTSQATRFGRQFLATLDASSSF